MKPILYILCGCAGCGKTTWANAFIASREICNIDIRYVSRDEIRFTMLKDGEDYFSHEEEVFNTYVERIKDCLNSHLDVIADATHITKGSRKKLLQALDRKLICNFNIIFVYFDTPYEVCCGRNASREGRARVPEDVMASMWRNFQKPSMTEDSRCIGLILMKGKQYE